MMETTLYRGTIKALTLDCTYEEILCIRLLDERGQYPTITYGTTMGSQLTPEQQGMFLKEVREITVQQLETEGHEGVWKYFASLDRGNPCSYLTRMWEKGYKLILHTDQTGKEYLVICSSLDITYQQNQKPPYWQLGIQPGAVY